MARLIRGMSNLHSTDDPADRREQATRTANHNSIPAWGNVPYLVLPAIFQDEEIDCLPGTRVTSYPRRYYYTIAAKLIIASRFRSTACLLILG